MKGDVRRDRILKILRTSEEPISGGRLAETMEVSRQVIVTDIALLRAKGHNIVSTNRGYVLREKEQATRVFKVIHSDEDTRRELETIVDLGGTVEDVFVYHRVYGVIRGVLDISSRRDIDEYIDKIKSGKSKLLKNTTSGYHYHTVTAASEKILDVIQEELRREGFLAKLQDYEPVDFWGTDKITDA